MPPSISYLKSVISEFRFQILRNTMHTKHFVNIFITVSFFFHCNFFFPQEKRHKFVSTNQTINENNILCFESLITLRSMSIKQLHSETSHHWHKHVFFWCRVYKQSSMLLVWRRHLQSSDWQCFRLVPKNWAYCTFPQIWKINIGLNLRHSIVSFRMCTCQVKTLYDSGVAIDKRVCQNHVIVCCAGLSVEKVWE